MDTHQLEEMWLKMKTAGVSLPMPEVYYKTSDTMYLQIFATNKFWPNDIPTVYDPIAKKYLFKEFYAEVYDAEKKQVPLYRVLAVDAFHATLTVLVEILHANRKDISAYIQWLQENKENSVSMIRSWYDSLVIIGNQLVDNGYRNKLDIVNTGIQQWTTSSN